eukprot:GGOE01017929.1.p1 GENE.GGOE01017929.1~~GGOE01017929.1.p1  ORF type:complete len:2233 (+),score=570.91 GGOE01017929.1:56-6754(+)
MDFPTVLWVFFVCCLGVTSGEETVTMLEQVSTYPVSTTCVCTTNRTGICHPPPSGCMTGHVIKFRVSGPNWNQGGSLPPNVTMEPLWYDPTDPSPAPATCEMPTRSNDNQVVACILRVPTTGVFNVTIEDKDFTTWLIIWTTGISLKRIDGANGCSMGYPGYMVTDCFHGGSITILAEGLGGLVGTYYPSANSSNYSTAEMRNESGALITTAGCSTLTITAEHLTCQLATSLEQTATLSFTFSMFRDGDIEINGQFGFQSSSWFIGTAIMKQYIEIFGYGGSNPQNGGTQQNPTSANATGFRFNTTDHVISIQLRTPVIRSITGSCTQSAALTRDPISLKWNVLPVGIAASGCMHGSTITIRGGGFAVGGTFIVFQNSTKNWNVSANARRSDSEQALYPKAPQCYSVYVISNSEVLCEVDLTDGSLEGMPFQVYIDSVVAYGTPAQFYASSTYSTKDAYNFSAAFTKSSFSGISGCVHSTAWPSGSSFALGCIGARNITFSGNGFYPAIPALNVITLTAKAPTVATPPTVLCIAATTTTLTCRLSLSTSYNADDEFTVSATILSLSLNTTLRFAQLTSQPRPLPIAGAFSGSAMASACSTCVSKLFAIGGKDSTGAPSARVFAYDASADSEGWTEQAAMPSARSCATAQGVPAVGSLGPANQFIYTFGGSDDSTSVSCYEGHRADRNAYAYNAYTNSWMALSPLPTLAAEKPINTTDTSGTAAMCITFDVLVVQDSVVTGINIDVYDAGNSQQWSVWYKSGTHLGSETSQAKWIAVASGTFVPAADGVQRFPGAFAATELRTGTMGGRYAFYICSSATIRIAIPSAAGVALPPGSPYLQVLTGYSSSGVFTGNTGLAEFTGALVITPQAYQCSSLYLKDTGNSSTSTVVGARTDFSFIMPTEIFNPVTTLEYTFHALASADIDMANDFNIFVTSPLQNTRAKPFAYPAVTTAIWPAGGGFFRMSSAASTVISDSNFAAASANLSSSSYANPVTFNSLYSDQALLELLYSPPYLVRGTWNMTFQDLNVNDGKTLTVLGVEIRLCWQQPGVIGMAAAAVDQDVYLTGGIGYGQFSYVSTTQNTFLRYNSHIAIPLYTDSFGSIDAIQIGVNVGGNVYSSNTDLALVVPQTNIGGSLEGQWAADGTMMDTSGNDRHSALLAYQYAFFAPIPDATSALYDVVHLYSGYAKLPFIPRGPAETRAAWVRLGYPMAGYDTQPTSRMCIICYGNAPQINSWYTSSLLVVNGAVVYEEASYSTTYTLSSAPLLINDTRWHHVAVARDAAARTVLYVDGVPRASMALAVWWTDQVSDLSIGRRMVHLLTTDPYRGMLYDVRIYSAALAASEIQTLYSGGVGGQMVSLISRSHAQKYMVPTGLQRFGTTDSTLSITAVAPSNNNYPDPSSALMFSAETDLGSISKPGGGRWLLVVSTRCIIAPECLNATDIVWGATISGQVAKPSSGTLQFDSSTQTYTGLSYQPMKTARFGHGMVAVGEKLYVIGGASSSLTKYTSPLADIEVSDTSLAQPGWTTGSSMSVGRFAPAVAVVGKAIYVVGGRGPGGAVNSIEVYNTTMGTWTLLTVAINTAHFGAVAGTINERLYIAGGLIPTLYGNPLSTYYSSTHQDPVFTNRPTDIVDYADFQDTEQAWTRMSGIGLVGSTCRSSSLSYDQSGAWKLGSAVASEAACVVLCATYPRCYAYEYGVASQDCFARLELDHICLSETGNFSSAYRAAHYETKTLQTSLVSDSTGVTVGMFDVVVQAVEDSWLNVTGLTLNVLTKNGQLISVYYRNGSYTDSGVISDSSAWTLVSTFQIAPVSTGKYYLAFPLPLDLTTGTHSFYVVAQLSNSLGFVAATSGIANFDYFLTVLSGAQASSSWGTTSGNGMLNVALHYSTPSDVLTSRTHCYVPPGVSNVGRADLPVISRGFSFFARITVINVTAQQGLLHKSYAGAQIGREGGFAISLVDSFLSIQTVGRWQHVGPMLKENTTYFVLVKYQLSPGPMWWVVIDDLEYNVSVVVSPETVLHDVYVGSEGPGINPWKGDLYWPVLDCTGPRVDSYSPTQFDDGIRPEDFSTITLQFDRPVALVGGFLNISESVWGGMYDTVPLNNSIIDVLDSTRTNITVHNDSAVVQFLLWAPFSFDVRCQVSATPGAVRSTFDAGVWLGLVQRTPGLGDYWFVTSDQYTMARCSGKPCATCRACRYQTTLASGENTYLCYLSTSRGGMVEITEYNVPTEPTADCP